MRVHARACPCALPSALRAAGCQLQPESRAQDPSAIEGETRQKVEQTENNIDRTEPCEERCHRSHLSEHEQGRLCIDGCHTGRQPARPMKTEREPDSLAAQQGPLGFTAWRGRLAFNVRDAAENEKGDAADRDAKSRATSACDNSWAVSKQAPAAPHYSDAPYKHRAPVSCQLAESPHKVEATSTKMNTTVQSRRDLDTEKPADANCGSHADLKAALICEASRAARRVRDGRSCAEGSSGFAGSVCFTAPLMPGCAPCKHFSTRCRRVARFSSARAIG